jgi:hypothetical protein
VKRAKRPDVLGVLIEAVRARFHEDRVAPGVVFAVLADGVYASIRRYENWDAVRKGGSRVCSVRGAMGTASAVAELAKKFHRLYAPPPVQDAFAKLKAVL